MPIARALRLDPEAKADKNKVKRLLKIWIENGMFAVVDGLDERRNRRSFVEVGAVAD